VEFSDHRLDLVILARREVLSLPFLDLLNDLRRAIAGIAKRERPPERGSKRVFTRNASAKIEPIEAKSLQATDSLAPGPP
jgi:hypothetical protein